MRVDLRSRKRASLLLGVLLSGLSLSAHAQQGSLAGTVTDRATGEHLENARVILAGPNRIETTGQDGQYTFRGVTPGRYLVRVLRLGYQPAADTAVVSGAERVALDFGLTPSPVQLDELVTTAGTQKRFFPPVTGSRGDLPMVPT